MPDETPADKFTGLTGMFKEWGSLGVIFFMCCLLGYTIIVVQPAMLREERAAADARAVEGRKHGDEAVKGMWGAMGKVTDKLEDVRLTLAHGQRVTQAKQDQQIQLQTKVIDAMGDKAADQDEKQLAK